MHIWVRDGGMVEAEQRVKSCDDEVDDEKWSKILRNLFGENMAKLEQQRHALAKEYADVSIPTCFCLLFECE